MDADLAMALGLVLGVFAVPALLSAFSEGRSPRVGAVVMLIAGGMILWAITEKPEGYSFADLPAVILNVMARYLP